MVPGPDDDNFFSCLGLFRNDSNENTAPHIDLTRPTLAPESNPALESMLVNLLSEISDRNKNDKLENKKMTSSITITTQLVNVQ